MIRIIMVIYQYVLTFIDFLYLNLICVYSILEAIFRLITPLKMKSVVGEVVLITGAGHGIGKEMSLQFARLGAKVVCLDINEQWNKDTVAQINKEGGTAWAFWCNVAIRDEVRAVSDKIRRVVGDVTILINNAGIMPSKPFSKHTPQEIEKIFEVNVYSQIWMIQEWLPTFQKNNHGHIVGVSSMCGVVGTPNLTPYCATKFAVTGLMDALAEELRYGSQNPNIKCTRIHPYMVDTGLVTNPRIKFPAFNPLVKAEKCAEMIVRSVRREVDIAFIPYSLYYVHKFVTLFPRKFQLAFVDFMDTGVDATDE